MAKWDLLAIHLAFARLETATENKTQRHRQRGAAKGLSVFKCCCCCYCFNCCCWQLVDAFNEIHVKRFCSLQLSLAFCCTAQNEINFALPASTTTTEALIRHVGPRPAWRYFWLWHCHFLLLLLFLAMHFHFHSHFHFNFGHTWVGSVSVTVVVS